MKAKTSPRWTAVSFVLLSAMLAGLAAPHAGAAKAGKYPSLERALAELKFPPDWWNDIDPKYDLSTPWKDARLEMPIDTPLIRKG